MLYVGGGWLVFELFEPLRGPIPLGNATDGHVVECVTELIVIVSLAAAGLKLDRVVGWVEWAAVWRLLSIAMVLTVVAAALLGTMMSRLSLAAAVLLGAVLAQPIRCRLMTVRSGSRVKVTARCGSPLRLMPG